MKSDFSEWTLKDVMLLLHQQDFIRWELNTSLRPPGEFLQEAMRRFDSFNLTNSEAAKLLLIDALFVEIVPSYPKLRVWKAALLESDTMAGVADYLIAPKRAYLATPILCAVEAKRDDFEQGRAQCLAEMAACQWNNRQEGHEIDIFGAVSNGQVWQFYKLSLTNEIYESGQYNIDDLPKLLGVLDYVVAECAKNVP